LCLQSWSNLGDQLVGVGVWIRVPKAGDTFFRVVVHLALTMGDTKPSLFIPHNPQVLSAVISVVSPTCTRITREPQNNWHLSKGNGSTRCSAASKSASTSMSAPSDASVAVHAHIATHVSCVESPAMDLQGVLPDEIFPIVMKLKANAWSCFGGGRHPR